MALTTAAVTGLAAGGVATFVGAGGLATAVWSVTIVVVLLPAVWWVAGALRQRQFGADTIAVLALISTLAVGEHLAGAVIAVMFSGGRALEERATQRAERDLSALMSIAPRYAHRRLTGSDAETYETIEASEVRVGDQLIVRPGEAVPVDGTTVKEPATIDESMITGEPLPVEIEPGGEVRSGTVNVGSPAYLVCTATADDSTYTGLVRLAREAAAGSAPFVRMADRYAAFLLPATLVLAGLAWLWSGDPVRAVAVLVVATPCPLILAVPIAFVSGMSRCARRGVVVKGGAALDRLAQARVLLFDKTGTVTQGRPVVADTVTAPNVPADHVVRLAASLDQASSHVLAGAIVEAGTSAGMALSAPSDVVEVLGQGVRGEVDGHAVAVGKAALVGAPVPAWAEAARRRAATNGMITVFVGVDGRCAGVLLLRDRIRDDAARTMRLLRRAGIERTVMITGDRADAAARVAARVGADAVHAEQTPAGKVDAVRAETAQAKTLMVGDGINDAPALAAADVGVALGARGASASSEAADVVITVDRLSRLAEAVAIARRTRAIARQSAVVGIGLSVIAMGAAAAGVLTPVVGALVQEAIDVVVILNALRALGPGRSRTPQLRGDVADLVRQLDETHRRIRPRIAALPQLAEDLADLDPPELHSRLDELIAFLTGELLPHEQVDEELLYPHVGKALGGTDATAPMSQQHAEIVDLVRQIELLVAETKAGGSPETLRDLRHALLALHSIVRLHNASEEQNYHVLADG
ncbi:heavy metal translocating P-type ATPase [Phytoactinopolyspora limicola]|uniref:heavy metal translocating P-type ATPase n=1 Tax=Phytoactinopolyspora limicola TaxID=2715536 RepID=UPI001A9C509F|nr:heavy metal translocating P-type ATPase [Phytoactinopolyspora limicola]